MRKYYDEDEDYEEGDQQQRLFLANERFTLVDWVLAAALGILVSAGMMAFALPGVIPGMWDAAAVAAHLRAPADVFPGFWRVLAQGLFVGGIPVGLGLLKILGPVCLGVTAGVVYLFLRAVIALLVRGRLRFAIRRYVVQRVAAAVGAVLFVCSDPAWRSGQAFSSEGLLLLLTVLAIMPFVLFMLNGSLFSAYASMFLLGAVAAETPLGLVFLAFCWFAYHLALRHDALGEKMPLLEPLTAQTAKWTLSFFWGLGLALGVVLNCWSFLHMGGGAMLTTPLPVAYLLRWWSIFMESTGSIGWVLAFGICVLPFAVASIMLPHAVDEEQFLPYHVGGLFFVSGVSALSQLSCVSALWFWSWSPLTDIRSPYILLMLLLLCAITASYFITVLGTDACCRNHVRLSSFRATDEESMAQVAARAPTRPHGLIVLGVVSAILLASSLPGVSQKRAGEMLGLLDDYVAEVLKETGDAKYLFTDGSFDARLELGAAAEGRKLTALSLLAGDSAYEKGLLQRAAADAEDRTALSLGAANALRTWKRDKPARFAECALMLGFPFWMRDGEAVPPCGGTILRPGQSAEDRAAGVAAARKLAERVVAFASAGGLDKRVGTYGLHLFALMQWRLARFADERARAADRDGDTATATAEHALAERLDDGNTELTKLVKMAENRRASTLRQVTPREGLQLALLRADFPLAARYAKIVLDGDPDDPDANFGAGMYLFQQKQWARAAETLARCLVRKPNEPAVLNNLALACLRGGRLDDAEAYVGKALALLPASDEVKATRAEIAKVRAKADAAAAKPAADASPAP